jgi:hypothetical protein
MILPYPTGGITDFATRIVTDRLSEIWHQPIVIEAKPTAHGNLAWEEVSRAKPDGYTWTVVGMPTITNPRLYANLRWSEKSFVPVGATVWVPTVLVVHPSLPVNTVAEFIDHVRKHPGVLSWANNAVGSILHLNMALSLKLDVVAVPYNGAPPAILATELLRFSELMVIARNSSFQYKGKAVDIRQVGRELGARYVLEGSVRRSGNRIRIAAQLIDAMTGIHRWGERYDRELHDAFAVQDEMARTIVAILAAHVNRAETERAQLKPPAVWEAYEYYLRGAEAFFLQHTRPTKGSLYDARRLLEQSLAIDPDYARAAAMLSWTHIFAYFEPFDGDYVSPAALDRPVELAEKAVHLDPRLPQARAQLGQSSFTKAATTPPSPNSSEPSSSIPISSTTDTPTP